MLQKLEIPEPSLLESEGQTVEEFRRVVRELRAQIGWHYYLDFAWIAQHLEVGPGTTVLDAGAGMGVMQWWLAMKGADVLSVDLGPRHFPGARFETWCRVRHYEEGRGAVERRLGIRDFLPPRRCFELQAWARKLEDTKGRLELLRKGPRFEGSITFYNMDCADLAAIPSRSVDYVVSVSALEHNDPDRLPEVVRELERVLKPGGRLVATLGAAKAEDWFHEPSRGWCYSQQSLERIFGFSAGMESNFSAYDQLLDDLRGSDFLRQELAESYFHSGDNGMPWGEWNPRYHSAGVLKQV